MEFQYLLYHVEPDEDGRSMIFDTEEARGRTFVLVWTGTFEAAHDDEEGVLAQVWKRHNLDDRPDGRLQRSTSVGDVIVVGREVHSFENREGWIVNHVGWKKVRFRSAYVDPRDPSKRLPGLIGRIEVEVQDG